MSIKLYFTPVYGTLSHSNKWTSGLYSKISLIGIGKLGTGIIIDERKNSDWIKKLWTSFTKVLPWKIAEKLIPYTNPKAYKKMKIDKR